MTVDVPARALTRGADVEFRSTVLPNGLTVLSERVPGVRSVAFGAWVRAATLHEPPERMGVTHFLEHMVFKGTERRSARQLALELEALGGSLDAYTSREHTVYQAKVLDEHLKVAADVIGDLVFRPLLRKQDVATERKVILEEIAMVEDTPDDLVFELHNAMMFEGHPHGYPILGTRETVSRLGVPELRELHDRMYHPGHLVVAAAGNVGHEELLDVLARTGWADVPRRTGMPPAVPLAAPVPPTVRHVTREGAQTHVVLGAPAVSCLDPRRHALNLVSVMLGGGMSSRLFQRVREELGLAYSVYSFLHFHADLGVHGIYVGTAPETARDATEAIQAELAALATHGLPADELAAGKTQLRGQLIMSLESVTNRMYRAASTALYGEPRRSLEEMLAEVEGVDHDAAAAACRDFFAPDKQTILSLGPG